MDDEMKAEYVIRYESGKKRK